MKLSAVMTMTMTLLLGRFRLSTQPLKRRTVLRASCFRSRLAGPGGVGEQEPIPVGARLSKLNWRHETMTDVMKQQQQLILSVDLFSNIRFMDTTIYDESRRMEPPLTPGTHHQARIPSRSPQCSEPEPTTKPSFIIHTIITQHPS